MTKYFCDFKNCNNVVERQRKITISRLNPYEVYFRFHACESCFKILNKSMINLLSLQNLREVT